LAPKLKGFIHFSGAGNFRWTMPNSSGVHDHDFGAIEAAIRETARGRAFLADYARKVRQSDTLTMLATIARLERWCADQAVRLAELERREQATGGRPPESQAGFVPALRGEPALMIGLADEDPVGAGEVIDDIGDEFACLDQSQEVRGRIEHLASAFCDFDRRVANVTRQPRVSGSFADTGLSMRVASPEGGAGAVISHAVASGPSGALWRDRGGQHALEEDVLDGIAKALGTRKTLDGW
jgi:hypothetical protein